MTHARRPSALRGSLSGAPASTVGVVCPAWRRFIYDLIMFRQPVVPAY
ncbi:MAG: hypothetical protein ABI351_08875 [Herbaspirillum sp.]